MSLMIWNDMLFNIDKWDYFGWRFILINFYFIFSFHFEFQHEIILLGEEEIITS